MKTNKDYHELVIDEGITLRIVNKLKTIVMIVDLQKDGMSWTQVLCSLTVNAEGINYEETKNIKNEIRASDIDINKLLIGILTMYSLAERYFIDEENQPGEEI